MAAKDDTRVDRADQVRSRVRAIGAVEGQMRIEFIREALAASSIANAQILLADCDDKTRALRLSSDRAQPELANAEMMNWACYLRQEANAAGVEILDTGTIPQAACVQYLLDRLG